MGFAGGTSAAQRVFELMEPFLQNRLQKAYVAERLVNILTEELDWDTVDEAPFAEEYLEYDDNSGEYVVKKKYKTR